MTDLREAAEMALEALEDYRFASGFERPLAQDAIDALRQALAMERFSEVSQEIEEALKQPKREWVGLTLDDVHDAFNYVEMVKLLDFDRDRPEWCEAFANACEARLKRRNGVNK